MADGTAPPIEEISGFNMSSGDGDPVEIVLNFCDHVPDMLEFIFLNDSFRDLVNASAEESHVNYDLFSSALKEAEDILRLNLDDIRNRLAAEGPENENINGSQFREQFLGQLQRIGFTGSSLELKANLLNWHISQVFQTLQEWGTNIVNFAINPIVKVIRKLLKLLNKLFESLKIVIPGFEAIKEIKDVGEEYLDTAEVMEDQRDSRQKTLVL